MVEKIVSAILSLLGGLGTLPFGKELMVFIISWFILFILKGI